MSLISIVALQGSLELGYKLADGSKVIWHSHDSLPRLSEDMLATSLIELQQKVKRCGELCKPAAIRCSSGPGSYTGLRMVMSFAKGLSVGWKVPLIPITIFDIARIRLKYELADELSIRLGQSVGKNRWIVVESKLDITTAPSCWTQMSEEEAKSYLQGDVPGFIIRSNHLKSALNSSCFDICFAEEMLREDITEPLECSNTFNPVRISQIEPDYGLVFSALTIQEQQKYRDG
ncbi:MAG: hypothetical protein ACO3XO_00295 [Bdellovibrionota bacterium]|jgi:tRNA A37 threonylcarbamoyladenosine modification protein TsaB